MPFDQIQCIDFRTWRRSNSNEAWQKLRKSLATLTSSDNEPLSNVPDAREALLPAVNKRQILLGGGAAVLALGLGLYAWSSPTVDRPNAEAELLFERATGLLQDGHPDELDQAAAYLLEATQLAPNYGPAWGALAMTYALKKFHVSPNESDGFDARSRSAARTALALDPNDVRALSSLVLLIPPYRRWALIEREAKELVRRHPRYPLTLSILAEVLTDVGRWREAGEVYNDISRTRHLLPLRQRSIIMTLWSSGDLVSAENVLAEDVKRWPRHPAIWDIRLRYLMHSGRAGEALELLEKRVNLPRDFSADLWRSSVSTCRALAGAADGTQAIRENLALLESGPPALFSVLNRKIFTAHLVAQRCASLGDKGTALEVLKGYYTGNGRWPNAAPAAGDRDRTTTALFEPPMSSLWAEPGFSDILKTVGLEQYWRETSTTPDLRAASVA